MKVLVVGGTGPTGPYIVEGLLKKGHEVTIFHRGVHEVEFSCPVEHIHGDPHFLETIKEALGDRKWDLVVSMYGRLRHIALAMKGQTARMIAIGGMPYQAFYAGWRHPDGVPVPVAEDAPLYTGDEQENKFTYRMVQSEQVVMEAHHQGHYTATLLRFPGIYGPRALAPREWSIIRRILDGRRQIIVPDGGWQLSRPAYAENAAHAVLLAVDQPDISSGRIYNVGDEAILTFRDWIRIIAQNMNWELEQVSIPFALARPARFYCDRPHHTVMDITRIKTELGYRDVVPQREAIERTVRYWLEHRPAPGSEAEQERHDPFDYDLEDRIIREYLEAAARLREISFVQYQFRHMYDHPTRPGETDTEPRS